MKVAVYSFEEHTYFEFNEVEEQYEQILKSLFYTQEGNKYYKKYPSDMKNMEQIKHNFIKNGVEMIEQFGYLKRVPWQECLKEFIEITKGTSMNWCVIGGCSLAVRGIPLETHDLDIMIDVKDIDLCHDVLADYLIEPICDTKGWVVNYFGVAFLRARVDLAFGPEAFVDNPIPMDFGPYAMDHLEEITWNGYQIKVPPVELYLNANKSRGRMERVKLIEDYLNKKV